MKMITLSVILFASLTLSCKKDKPSGIDIENTVDILLLNQSSENLLTPPSGLTTEDINLYYVKNGVKTLYNERNLDEPKGIWVFKDTEGQERLRVHPVMTDAEISETFVEFGDLGTDTIRCQYVKSGYSAAIIKVWLNGIVKWDRATSANYPQFTLIK